MINKFNFSYQFMMLYRFFQGAKASIDKLQIDFSACQLPRPSKANLTQIGHKAGKQHLANTISIMVVMVLVLVVMIVVIAIIMAI